MTEYRQRKIRQAELVLIDALNANLPVEFFDYYASIKGNGYILLVWCNGDINNAKVRLDLQTNISAKLARESLKLS